MEGYDIKFEYVDDVSSTTLAGKDEILDNKRTFIPLTLKVLSKDGTLSELKAIGNNGIDYLENKFIPSSINNLEYNLSVPNNVENITFNGTTTSSVKGINGLNTINNLSNGANIFNISITAANGEITLYKININKMEDDNISNLITSSTYEINRFENSQNGEVNHVIGLEPKTTLKEFKSKFDNPYSILHVYDKNGNELTDENAYVGTKMVVKLINANNIVDELTIVVRGDLIGNGVINYTDYFKLKEYLVGNIELNYIEFASGRLTGEAYVSITDSVKMRNYLLGNIESVNKKKQIASFYMCVK